MINLKSYLECIHCLSRGKFEIAETATGKMRTIFYPQKFIHHDLPGSIQASQHCNVMLCNRYYLLAEPFDRIMQLNWLHFCGIYASWYHWNCGQTQHKAATINQLECPSYSLYVQLLWYPMYYPGGMKARVSPVQWSKPYSILAPTQDSNPGGRIQNHKL